MTPGARAEGRFPHDRGGHGIKLIAVIVPGKARAPVSRAMQGASS